MGRKSRNLKANLYEDYDLLEDFELEEEPQKQTKQKRERKNKNIKTSNKELNSSKKDIPISTKFVECSCNKCGTMVLSIIVGCIYNPLVDLEVPFVTYTCPNCKHNGHRTVFSKGLPPDQFEKEYF